MFISQELRKTNIAEYLLYMWQVENMRTIFDDHGIRIINQVIGAAVTLFASISLFGTVTNLYRFF